MKKIKIEVAQMCESFLYLPLYYAISEDFFGFLNTSEHRYEVDVKAIHPGTDEAVFKCLMNEHANEFENVLFAIGDPRSLAYSRNPTEINVALIGALVTGTAFWALNHGRLTTTEVNELATFPKIVSFKRGTTSYDLAASIVQGGGSQAQILEVEPRQELQALCDPSNADAVILSPDTIGIAELLRNNPQFQIELSIGRHHEYCDLLVTAIATTRDTIRNHPLLVSGFLKGIQRALYEVQNRSPALLEFARERFNKSEKLILDAFKFIDEAKVYPHTIQLSEALWMRAFTGPLMTNGKAVAPEERLHAKQVYGHIGRPYEPIAMDAIRAIGIGTEKQHVVRESDTLGSPLMLRVDILGLLYLAFSLCITTFIASRASIVWSVASLAIAVIVIMIGVVGLRRKPDTKPSVRIAFWLGSGVLQLTTLLLFIGFGLPSEALLDLSSSQVIDIGKSYSAVAAIIAGCYAYSVKNWADHVSK